ncbi:MAG: DUF5995 family protein, partial [Myxococcota bacterium]
CVSAPIAALPGAQPASWQREGETPRERTTMHRGALTLDARDAGRVDYPALIGRARAVGERIQAYTHYFDRNRSKLAVFAATYVKSTEGVLKALREDAQRPPGERFFQDPVFIVELTERFAHRYFVAMSRVIRESSLPAQGAPPPTLPEPGELGSDPWSEIHQTIEARGTTAYIDFAYGALVHINYDLPVVLSDLGLYDSKGQELDRIKIADFQRFNSILGGSIDRVQKEVIERYDRRAWVINAITLRWDERVGARVVERARERALNDARALAAGEAPCGFAARFSRFLRRLTRVTEPVRATVMLTRRPDSRIWP